MKEAFMKDKSIIILGTDLQYDELSFNKDKELRTELLYLYDHIVGKKKLFYSEDAHIVSVKDLSIYRESFLEEVRGWTDVIYVSNDPDMRRIAMDKGIKIEIGDSFIDDYFKDPNQFKS